MVKVVGAELREGDYQGNHYKNYILYVVNKDKGPNELFGVCPRAVKIRSKFVDDNNINLKEYFQHDIEIYYDAYGNVSKIDG